MTWLSYCHRVILVLQLLVIILSFLSNDVVYLVMVSYHIIYQIAIILSYSHPGRIVYNNLMIINDYKVIKYVT